MTAPNRFVYPFIAVCASVAFVALLVAVALAAGTLPHAQAQSDEAFTTESLLGIGSVVTGDGGVWSAADKIEVSKNASLPTVLTTPLVRVKAPLPQPRQVRVVLEQAPRAFATGSPASSPSAGSTGWRSARASWYGPGFYGRRTASGAVLTKDMMNVAHRTLPFGTRVKFEFRGRTATAVVNDRGPFISGRVWDLGPGTAKTLGFTGVASVRYKILGR